MNCPKCQKSFITWTTVKRHAPSGAPFFQPYPKGVPKNQPRPLQVLPPRKLTRAKQSPPQHLQPLPQKRQSIKRSACPRILNQTRILISPSTLPLNQKQCNPLLNPPYNRRNNHRPPLAKTY